MAHLIAKGKVLMVIIMDNGIKTVISIVLLQKTYDILLIGHVSWK